MDRGVKKFKRITGFLIFFVFLISAAGCGSSGKVSVMPAMQNKTEIKAKEYKVVVAESRNLDTFLNIDALVAYDDSEELSFKIDNCNLKAVYVKEDDNVVEGQLLAELDGTDLEYRLAGRQVDLQRVQLEYNRILYEPDTGNPDRNTQLESLKLDMESIMLDINHITGLIGETQLVAPFSGVITELVEFEPGETIQAFKKIMTIWKPGSVKLTSAVLNRPGDFPYKDLSGVVTGMKVVLIYGFKETRTEIPATITRIENMDPGILPDPSRILAAPPPFKIYVKPDGENADKLFVDHSVTLRISTGQLKNVVALPESAIRGVGQDKIIQVLKGDKVINRRVTTGYQDNDENIVVVTSGLRPGESVILN